MKALLLVQAAFVAAGVVSNVFTQFEFCLWLTSRRGLDAAAF